MNVNMLIAKPKKFSTSNIKGHHYTSSQRISVRSSNVLALQQILPQNFLGICLPHVLYVLNCNNGPCQSSRRNLLKQNIVCTGHLRAESVPVWTNWTQNKKSRMLMTK
jgi:hypothetical protein